MKEDSALLPNDVSVAPPRPTMSLTHIALLGDSIFDNAAYVAGGPAVIDHLRDYLKTNQRATILANDGACVAHVRVQLSRLPSDVTHLVLSIGGNDALGSTGVMTQQADTVQFALHHLNIIRRRFRNEYRDMLANVLALQLPTAVCTIYDAVPGLEPELQTALCIFNDSICREAMAAGVPIIDLRAVCDEPDDYSIVSPIEPSAVGGAKIARVIHQWLLGFVGTNVTNAKSSCSDTGQLCVLDERPPATSRLALQKLIEEKRGVSTPPQQPSPFYDLLVGAYSAEISYPVSGDELGPHFDADGNVEDSDGQEIEVETIQVVDLGGGCYRFGDNGMFSVPTLHWGDEFLANEKDGVLELVKLLPRKFKHYDTIGKASSLDVVHRFGGGWAEELMCLLVTIPLDQAEAFEREIGFNEKAVF
jgi:hypothetical protein